jgi:REP element-mobilizing transposase RayT
MANSNNRIKEYNTIHHLVSRIAHRVYFLKDDERKDFMEILRRTSEFCGVKLLGWCVMGNHFHILVYLPIPAVMDENEVIRRYGILKGEKVARNQENEFIKWRKQGDSGEKRVEEWLDNQRRRMYSMSNFMKIVKQWFTAEYNSRNGHKGTLWEAVYYDRVVNMKSSEMAKCLGYIHLNPIRAAETDKYDGYVWSSYCAFCKGDPVAIDGMRFVYGDEMSMEEIAEIHEELLASLLENEKLKRAEEIARKRVAGYEVPNDPLTTEAMIAQQTARLKEVQKAALEFREKCAEEGLRAEKCQSRERAVLALLEANPEIDVPNLAERMSLSVGIIYRVLRKLKKQGVIAQDGYCGRWIVNCKK